MVIRRVLSSEGIPRRPLTDAGRFQGRHDGHQAMDCANCKAESAFIALTDTVIKVSRAVPWWRRSVAAPLPGRHKPRRLLEHIFQ